MRPSINTSEPFFKYCCAISACFPHTTILCHSVRFCLSPLRSLYVSSVATENFGAAFPPAVNRGSGSRPNLPTKITLFTDILSQPLSQYGFTPRVYPNSCATHEFLSKSNGCVSRLTNDWPFQLSFIHRRIPNHG